MEIDEEIVVCEETFNSWVCFEVRHVACRSNSVRNILNAAAVVGISGRVLISIHTLVGGATVPSEIIALSFDIEPDQVNFTNLAPFVIQELNLIPESFLNRCDEMIMQYWWWDAISTVHDWETKTKSFLLDLTIRSSLLCATSGSSHSIIILRIRITMINGGSWSRSGGAVRHRLLVPVQNLRGFLVEIT